MAGLLQVLKDAEGRPGLKALAVVAAAVVLARLVDLLLCRLLSRLSQNTRTQLDDQLIEHLHRPIFFSVILGGLHAALLILALDPVLQFPLVALLVTLAIFIWTRALLKVAGIALQGLSRQAGRRGIIEARTLPLFDNLAKVFILGGALYCLLSTWHLDVTPWLTSAGIAGVALGFAAKDTLANLFGGLSIIADTPYKLGDFIVLDSGERGMVTRIGIRSTRLLTRDDMEIILPNAQIASAKIVNESGGPWRKQRLAVRVGVAYGSDVDEVRRVLLKAAAGVQAVAKEPAPRVRFDAFGESSLDFRLLCWVDDPSMRGACLDILNTAVYKEFMALGISIPFPQRDVHIKEAPGGGGDAVSGTRPALP
ncbi:MAG: mechanosensitive ion channel family protein [Acidobacteriota bacterium]